MNKLSVAALSGARFAVVAVLGILLSGCVIASTAPLVEDSEAFDLLPASFYAFGYSEDGDARKPSSDDPQLFTRTGHTYTAEDESLALRFVPLAEAHTYLLAAVGPDSSLYGVARYQGDGILAIDMLLEDDELEPLIAADRAAGVANLDGVVVEDGGLTVTDRNALDQLVRMHLEGRLPMEVLVAYIADSADADKPAHIVPDGDFWKAVD